MMQLGSGKDPVDAYPMHTRAGFAYFHYHNDCRRFRKQRQEYYRYLADLLQGLRGGRSLRDIFAIDSVRYGPANWRGRLYGRWAALYEASGGDLYAIWADAIPQSELGVLRSAQSRGNDVFNRCLSELADVLERMGQMQGNLVSTLWAAAAAAIVLVLVLLALPLYTLPQLLGAFAVLDPSSYGPRTRALVGFAVQIESWAPVMLVATVVTVVLVVWSLDHLTGALRSRLDHFAVWWAYRQIQAHQLLAMLVIVLGRDDYGPVQLRTALQLLHEGAAPWMQWQLGALRVRLELGLEPSAVFDTGLLDRQHRWLLADMIGARGLCGGLALTSSKLHEHLRHQVARRALRLRWGILLACVGSMIGLTLWHYAVIDELRRALINFYAGH